MRDFADGFYWYRQTKVVDGAEPDNEWLVVQVWRSALTPHLIDVSFPGTDIGISLEEALETGDFGHRIEPPTD